MVSCSLLFSTSQRIFNPGPYHTMSFSAVETLRNAFPPEQLVLYGVDDEFGKLNSSYLSSLENEIIPTGIFLPKSAEDVSKFITIFKEYALDGVSGQIASMPHPKD